MSQIETKIGDTALSIAQRELGNSGRWREILDLVESNPFEGITPGQSLDIDQITDTALNVLGTVAGDSKIVSTITTAVGEINNILDGDAESILTKVAEVTGLRQYGDTAIKLVDWLL